MRPKARILTFINQRTGWLDYTTNPARFFFYDGTGQPQSMVKSWDRVFQKVFTTATPAIRADNRLWHHLASKKARRGDEWPGCAIYFSSWG